VLAAAFAGLLAGIIHVVTGPDHLAALAPLALRARRRGWLAGARWGLGHSIGVLVVAAVAVALRATVHLDALQSWGERLVGAALIVLGLSGLRRLWRDRLHAHEHDHDGERHLHFHAHRARQTHEDPSAHTHGHAAFWVGTIHGLAGTAHLLGVLPSLALPTLAQTIAYLVLFAAGTVGAMAAFAGAVGAAAPGRSEVGVRVQRFLLATASGLCAGTGVAWLVLPALGVGLP